MAGHGYLNRRENAGAELAPPLRVYHPDDWNLRGWPRGSGPGGAALIRVMTLHPGKVFPVLHGNVTRHNIVHHEPQNRADRCVLRPELSRKFVSALEQSGVTQAVRMRSGEPVLSQHLLLVLEMLRNMDQ